MDVNYEQLKTLINECDEENCLEQVLDRLKTQTPHMSKEEAIIRLLLELPRS